MKKHLIVLFILMMIIPAPFCTAENSDKKITFDYAFDAYYTWAELDINPAGSSETGISEEDELKIYKKLFSQALLPKSILIEFSINPMPCMGVIIKKHLSGFYDSAGIFGQNMVQSICTGFEEPAALSVMAGNFMYFKPKTQAGNIKGKAYMGYLASVGNYHIKDNELIADNWLELEWKVKGDRSTPERDMKWSYRVGGKLHGNPEIRDVLYLSLSRGRIDRNYFGSSLFKNSNFMYVVDFACDEPEIIKHYFIVGKSFPVKNSKLVFTLDIGFQWEGEDRYIGSLRRSGTGGKFQVIFQPNIVF